MFAKIQGTVGLSVIVETDGSVREVRVMRSLGYGLDEQAIASVRRWRFRPATKDGVAVRVVVGISVGFNLKGETPPSTWPALFPGATDAPVDEAEWDETKAAAAGLTLRVPHPKTWEARTSNSPSPAITVMRPDGRHFLQISEPRPLPAPLPLPFPVTELERVTQSLYKVIGLHNFKAVGGGQALGGTRWWLWQDQQIPTSETSRLPPEVRDAMSAEFDGLRLWLFLTTVENQVVMVFCWALVPRGLSPADLEKDLRSATAVFDRVIKRMVLQKSGT
jgi:TonB family protein